MARKRTTEHREQLAIVKKHSRIMLTCEQHCGPREGLDSLTDSGARTDRIHRSITDSFTPFECLKAQFVIPDRPPRQLRFRSSPMFHGSKYGCPSDCGLPIPGAHAGFQALKDALPSTVVWVPVIEMTCQLEGAFLGSPLAVCLGMEAGKLEASRDLLAAGE